MATYQENLAEQRVDDALKALRSEILGTDKGDDLLTAAATIRHLRDSAGGMHGAARRLLTAVAKAAEAEGKARGAYPTSTFYRGQKVVLRSDPAGTPWTVVEQNGEKVTVDGAVCRTVYAADALELV